MQRALPIILAIALAFSAASCSQTNVQQEMSLAVDAARRQQYSEAAKHAEKCLDLVQDRPDAMILFNYASFLSENRESARRQALYNLSKATKLHPERYDSWLFYGWALVENGEIRDAIPPLEKAFAMVPKDSPHRAKIQVMLGKCYVTNNLQSKALQILQPLRARKPYNTWPELYNCLGMLALQRQSIDAAIGFFKQGLELEPENPVLLQNLAVTYDLYKNDAALARKTYVKCLKQKNEMGDTDGCRRISNRLRRLAKRP